MAGYGEFSLNVTEGVALMRDHPALDGGIKAGRVDAGTKGIRSGMGAGMAGTVWRFDACCRVVHHSFTQTVASPLETLSTSSRQL